MLCLQKTAAQLLGRLVTLPPSVTTNFPTAPLRKMSTPATPPVSIAAAPAAGQRVLHSGKEYTTIKEGLAYILVPATADSVPQTTPKGENQAQSVFYNPIQQFNRDLSVLAIKAYGEEKLERKKAEAERRQNFKKNKKRKRGENEGHAGTVKVAKVTDELTTGQQAVEPSHTTEDAPIEDNLSAGNAEGDKSASGAEPVQSGQDGKGASTVEQSATESDTKSAVDPEGTTNGDGPLKSHSPSFTILDALSATGLRALRYAQEIPFTTAVTANDLLAAATESIKINVAHNKLSEKITPLTGNALAHMYSLAFEKPDAKGVSKPKYDVIDLDPYGTAAPFLDASVQAVKDGGLLCVTCTDAGVWASNGYPEKAYSLYGGLPIKGQHSHEAGLRLILHAIATSAARYGLAMEPLLSLSIDFYARVFVRIRKSPAEVKYLAGKTMVVYNCDSGCGAWTTQLLARNKIAENKKGSGTFFKHVLALAPNTSEHCAHCGSKTHMAGPMYAGPLHSPSFVKRILDGLPHVSKETYMTTTRIEGMLSMALEETLEPLDHGPLESPTARKDGELDPAAVDLYPFFFIPSVLSKVIHCVTPHENAMRGALLHLGYRVTRSHTKAGSIKTDAPWSVIWEVMREWAKQKAPIRKGAVREGTAGWKLLGFDGADAAPEDSDRTKIVFDEELGKEKDKKRLVRYQLNPRENWGPMNRAKG